MRPGAFAASLVLAGQRSAANVERTRRGVILKLFSAVILDTPVDTGRLRGNWRCGMGQPDLGLSDTTDKPGQVTISAMEKRVLPSTSAEDAWLSNSLPYAQRIEYEGWSTVKAPSGMVRINVARFNTILSNEAGK